MKRYSWVKRTLCSLGISCLSSVLLPVFAQSPSQDLVTAVNSIRAALDSIVNTAATYLFQTVPNVGNELVTNNTHTQAAQTIAPAVQTLNNNDIQNGIAPNVANPNAQLIQMASIQASDTILPSTLVGGIPVPFYSQAMQSSMQAALTQGNANMDFATFFNPCAPSTAGNNSAPNCSFSYSTSDLQNFALNYIRFVSGFATPISNLSLSSYPQSQLSTQQKLMIQNTASYQTYQVQRRQLVSIQSAALSSLYQIYQRRLPIQSIHPSDTALGVDKPSAAQIEDYLANWRTSNPTWYTQMSTASPSAVSRELLFVLAEIQSELHRIHLDNERLIALTAINELTSLQTSKEALNLAEKQVQSQISEQIKKNAAQGGTTATTQTATQPPLQQAEGQRLKQQQQQIQAQQKEAAQQANPNTPAPRQ